MNQQAAPSIILSVLIVGFFAVALFPRQPARARQRAADPAESSPARLEPVADLAPAPTPHAVKPGTISRGGAPRPVALPATAARSRADGAVIRKTSRTTVHSEPERLPLPKVSRLPVRPREAHQPAQPVTIVRADETIADVAFRVYGTTTQAEALWRANRDALPARDSRLVPGTLLRTPTLR